MLRTIVILLLLAVASAAQSGRVTDDSAVLAPVAETTRSGEELFNEANGYFRAKASELQQKKVPYDEKLEAQIKREQRELAAKYASVLTARKDLAAAELYFLGRLHFLASNPDGATETLTRFLASEGAAADRKQTSRTILAVIAAQRGKFADAEKQLADYLSNDPTSAAERLDMESEIAKAYRADGNLTKAAPHAEEAFRAAKNLFARQTSRTRAINDIYDSGLKAFEIYRDARRIDEADRTVEDLRKTAGFLESTSMYYSAVNERFRLLAENGRRDDAIKFLDLMIAKAGDDFLAPGSKTDIVRRLRRREKQFRMIGLAAPELPDVAEWFPGKPAKFAELRGKVILLDFWATWCGPCIAAFPSLASWHNKYGRDGLVILGVTGFTGSVDGDQAPELKELEFLKDFRKEHQLGYDFVVGRNFDNQALYGASSIPTTIIIDRKGIVRYAEVGSGREDEIERELVRLLSEK